MKKYKLTDEVKYTYDKIPLYRIEACKEIHIPLYKVHADRLFITVQPGEKGGWVSSEENLSQDGNCWVADDAIVTGEAKVTGDAYVKDHAVVKDRALVYSNAKVRDHAMIYENAIVYGSCNINDNAQVYGDAQVHGSVSVSGNAKILDHAEVYGNGGYISDHATVAGHAKVESCEFDDLFIGGFTLITGDAIVKNNIGYKTFQTDFFPAISTMTWTRSNNKWAVPGPCEFYGTEGELITEGYKVCEMRGKYFKAMVNYIKEIDNIINPETKPLT